MIGKFLKRAWAQSHPATRAGFVLGLLTAISGFFWEPALDRDLPDHPTLEQYDGYFAWVRFAVIMVLLHLVGVIMMCTGAIIEFRHKKRMPGD